MEKTKLQTDFPLETYGGLEDLRVTQPEISTEELTLAELLELMKFPNQEIPEKIRQNFGGVEGLCTHLLTTPDTGLRIDDPSDLERRRRKFGSNSIPPRKRKSFCYFLFEAIQDTTLIILIIAAIISLGLSFYSPPPSSSPESADPTDSNAGFIEGIGILVAVVIIVLVTAGINYNKDAQFRGLQKQMADQYKCSVVRSGSVVQLGTTELVVGDICLVEYGDVIPADGVIIRSNDLRLDESSHSGESKHIVKDVNSNSVLYAGTQVIEGSGKMVVTGVGLNSAKGIIFSLLGATENDEAEPEEKKSPLHKKLSSLAMQIAYIGTSIAVLTFLVLVLRFCIEVFVVKEKPWSHSYVQEFVSFLIISITILVVAVPEGLPLAVILALAYSIKKMVNDNNLVRHLDACEVMGHATTILCDKTGTLTTNKMTVVRSYVAGFTHENASSLRRLQEETKLLIASSIANNTSYKTQLQGAGKLCTQVGNRTECALLGFVGDLGYDYRYLREQTPEKSFVKVFPFTSDKKWMGTVVPKGDDDSTSGYRLFVKGAWEIILTRCHWILDSNSEVTELTDERRKMTQEEFVEPMSTNGLRVLAIAYKDFTSEDTESKHDEKMTTAIDWDGDDEAICCRLVCLAIVGIEDPVRPEVPDAVRKCQKAGITVRMVTGDHMDTARFVAIKCGIFNPGEDHLGIDGPDFNQRIRSSSNQDPEMIDQNLFDQLWPRLRILARSSPLDKYNLVKGIMSCPVDHDRQIVAVTGDGTNDGPALRQAHVGLAMGVTGTDVAKEASDIILLDDNFSSIVKAVVWGRHVYDSIAKFVQFQLTVNIVAVALAFIGACVVMDSPLKGVQMLWVNLLMDSLASLCLATEQPTNDVLLRKPYGSSQHLVSCIMAVNILSHSAYELTVLLTILFIGADWLDVDDGRDPSLRGLANSHYTFLFNTFVMMILFNEINARKIDGNQNVFSGIFSSPIFILIWLASFVTQVIIVEVGGSVFFTCKLTWDQWLWSIFLGISDLLYGQVVTYVANIYNRHRKQRQTKLNDLDFSLNSRSSSSSSENTEYEMSSSADSAPLYDATAAK